MEQRFEGQDLRAIAIAIDLVEAEKVKRNIRNRQRAELARAKTSLYRLWRFVAEELGEERDYHEWRQR